MLLEFATRHLAWLKRVPLLPQLLDQAIKLESLIFRKEVLATIDAIVHEVEQWPNVSLALHRFGGIELQLRGREFGHVHSNGLLDIYFGMEIRDRLMTTGAVEEHHVYPGSGWTSFYIRNSQDLDQAIALLGRSYDRNSSLDHR